MDSTPKHRVLIVEDMPENIQAISTILYQKGMNISIAQSGEEALRAVEQKAPDLILLDIMMPGMDGYEVCRRVRDSPETQHIPVIFLTGKKEPQDIVAGFECGAVDYVTKPFQSAELLARVMTHLELKRARDELEELHALKEQYLSDALRESEELHRVTLSQISDAVFLTDDAGDFTWVCENAVFIFGYSIEEVYSLGNARNLLGPGLFNPANLWQKGEIQNIECSVADKRGREHILLVNVKTVAITGGTVLYTCHDITDRKHTQEALRISENRYRELIGNMSSGVAVYDAIEQGRDFVFKDLNKAGEHISRVSRDAVIGKRLSEVFSGVKEIGLLEVFQRVFDSGIPERHPVSLYEDNRLSHWVENFIYQLPTGEIVAIYNDTTEREQAQEELCKYREHLEELVKERTAELQQKIVEHRQVEEALQQAKESLETANRNLEQRVQEELKKRQEQQQLLIQRSKLESLGKLAAGIAHEINQPLTGISMGLDNIAFRLSSDNVTKDYLQGKIDNFLEDIERMNHIIKHVRTFSRDQTSVVFDHVNVNDVCHNALSMLQAQYAMHNVTIMLKLDEKIAYVIGNTYRLEQVLLNLIANAKDAVDDKEKMGEKASYQKHITISTSCDADRVYVNIQDNGSGIPAKYQDQIFDPFFSTKGPEQGTGLGLSISYGIIKEMQGEIRVESQPGEYTIMGISLPAIKSYKV